MEAEHIARLACKTRVLTILGSIISSNLLISSLISTATLRIDAINPPIMKVARTPYSGSACIGRSEQIFSNAVNDIANGAATRRKANRAIRLNVGVKALMLIVLLYGYVHNRRLTSRITGMPQWIYNSRRLTLVSTGAAFHPFEFIKYCAVHGASRPPLPAFLRVGYKLRERELLS